MLGQEVKQQLESITAIVTAENPFFQYAESGKMTREQMVHYLRDIHYLFRQTCICLDVAAKESEKLGDFELAAFFKEKIGEEVGHDEWAKNDLNSFGQSTYNSDADVSPTMKQLVSYIREIIQKNPKLYLIYMAYAEYFTVLATPKFLKDLNDHCNIGPEMMTALGYHEQLDREHSETDFKTIDQFIGSNENHREYLEVLKATTLHFSKFLSAIALENEVNSFSHSGSASTLQ